MVSAVDELVKVTCITALVLPIAVLGNLRLGGENVTGVRPGPVRFTTCVPGGALSTREIAPSIEPTVLGEKLIVKVQVAPGARLDPHVETFENSPLAATLVMVSVLVVLVFLTVTVFVPLVVPTACFPKVSAAGVSVTVCAVLKPFRLRKSTTDRHTRSFRIMGPPRRLADAGLFCCPERPTQSARQRTAFLRNLDHWIMASGTSCCHA